jgi:hypothetical protein
MIDKFIYDVRFGHKFIIPPQNNRLGYIPSVTCVQCNLDFKLPLEEYDREICFKRIK